MRLRLMLAVSLASAALAAAGVLVVAWAAGWLGDGSGRTVVVEQPASAVQAAAPAPAPPRVRPLLGGRFDPARIYASRSSGVVTIYAYFGSGRELRASQGSGFVVSRNGVILTNSHVITTAGAGDGKVTAAERVYVEFSDRDRVPARIVGWDVFDDVGVLRVGAQAHALRPLPLGDSSRTVVGEPVAAIGSPFGNEGSLTVGVVSATRRSIESLTSRFNLVDAIQVDAPINHGNSGGPLFDATGSVIGINAQIRSTSGSSEGVGFAVPINAARRSMAQLLATGKVAYAYMGVTSEDLTPAIARRFRYPVQYGAVITSVRPGGPAAKAGLRGGDREVEVNGAAFTHGGDVVLAIGDRPVRSSEDLVRVVSEQLRPGQTAFLAVLRDGARRRVPVVLGSRPENPDEGR